MTPETLDLSCRYHLVGCAAGRPGVGLLDLLLGLLVALWMDLNLFQMPMGPAALVLDSLLGLLLGSFVR